MRKIICVAAYLAAVSFGPAGWVLAEPEHMPIGPPTPSEPMMVEGLASEPWLGGSLMPGPSMPTGGMSDWDYYAGSVYANTSPVWVDAEYLLWWIRGNSMPALVTTSSNGTPIAQAGVLGEPNTSILFGNDRVDGEARSGFRTSLGVRLGHLSDALMDAEIEGSFFWLDDGHSTGNYGANSLGDPILARPFTNAQTGLEDAQIIAFPGIATGGILVETDSDLISAGLRFRRSWSRSRHARVDWLLGYRYLRLQENISFGETLVSTDPAGSVDVGTIFDVYDRFATRNEFHGVDLGLQWWLQHGNWSAELLTKIAVGTNLRTVEVFGETLVFPPASDAYLTDGGFLALPTNMGRHRSDEFAVLPELGVKLRRQITHSFVLTLGYTVMVVNHAVRTGDQIDSTINTSQLGNNPLAGPARPVVSMRDSNLWVHGLSIGLEW